MARYEMNSAATGSGSTGGGGAMTIERYIAMQAEDKQSKSQKRMQWLTLGIGAFGLLNANAQQPIEDKRSSVDAPAIADAAADVEDFDFSGVTADATVKQALADFASTTAKMGNATATALQRGVDNNGKQGILGGASGNNNNLLLLLGFGLLLADD